MDSISLEAKIFRISKETSIEKSVERTFLACELCRTRQGSVYLYGEVDDWFRESSVERETIEPDIVINVPQNHNMLHSYRFANLNREADSLLVRFSGNKPMFEDILFNVKTLHGRKWDETNRWWIVPATAENIVCLMDLHFHLDRRAWKKYLGMPVAGPNYSLDELGVDIPCLYSGVECDEEHCPNRGVEIMCPL